MEKYQSDATRLSNFFWVNYMYGNESIILISEDTDTGKRRVTTVRLPLGGKIPRVAIFMGHVYLLDQNTDNEFREVVALHIDSRQRSWSTEEHI